MSNANARCTLSCSDIENYNQQLGSDPAGAPIKVFTYSGRDSNTMPPVWVAKNPDEGVVIGASIQSAATATEIGASGVRRQPWANAPFVPGALADYMQAQFTFFNSDKIAEKPVMAGLNYFLTHSARGGAKDDTSLLGEKRDVIAWLSWLERYSHGDLKAIDTPIGFIPKYDDLAAIFQETISKEYTKELYDKQFAFYVDNIIARLDLQTEAYGKEDGIPAKLFDIYATQKKELLALKEKHGSIIAPDDLVG